MKERRPVVSNKLTKKTCSTMQAGSKVKRFTTTCLGFAIFCLTVSYSYYNYTNLTEMNILWEAQKSMFKPIITDRQVGLASLQNPPIDWPYHRWNETERLARNRLPVAKSVLNRIASLEPNYWEHCFVLHDGRIETSNYTNMLLTRGEGQINRAIWVLEALTTMISLGNMLAAEDSRIRQLMSIINGTDHPGLPLLHIIADFGSCCEEYAVFTFDKRVECASYWPTVDYSMWSYNKKNDLKSMDAIKKFYQMQQQKYPWEKKTRKAVWRGSSTGNKTLPWRDLPRSKLVNASMLHPDILDVGYYAYYQRGKESEVIKAEFGRKKMIPIEDFQTYIAVIDIDGNAWSSRFPNLLCQNSVVLKVDSSYETYFEQSLTPWVHYVPVKSDLSDLVEVVNHALAEENVLIMQEIVSNANEWCTSHLSNINMAHQMLWTLVGYSELLNASSFNWQEQWGRIKNDLGYNASILLND
mmetsp:Transcript_26099/g.32016  ORF Transcript_26099/g.32016 Transcript_26099/m.32016 type:complete len:469 (-) Transcript_26099:19-1425(-)